MTPASLYELPMGTEGIVESVQGPADVRRRLLEMGFCNRARVTPIRRAPLGDPVEFSLRGYCVSLRQDEARCVLVIQGPSALDSLQRPSVQECSARLERRASQAVEPESK